MAVVSGGCFANENVPAGKIYYTISWKRGGHHQSERSYWQWKNRKNTKRSRCAADRLIKAYREREKAIDKVSKISDLALNAAFLWCVGVASAGISRQRDYETEGSDKSWKHDVILPGIWYNNDTCRILQRIRKIHTDRCRSCMRMQSGDMASADADRSEIR